MKKCFSILMAFVLAFTPMFITGCGVDQVIAGLQVADNVAKSSIAILAPVSPVMGDVLTRVSTDLETIVKAYQDYDAAIPSLKASKGDLIRATVKAIQGNLAAILQDAGVKNSGVIKEVTIAVAVVNSAITVLFNKVQFSELTQAQSAMVGSFNLPIVQGAKSAKDLKKAWNDAVAKTYPASKI